MKLRLIAKRFDFVSRQNNGGDLPVSMIWEEMRNLIVNVFDLALRPKRFLSKKIQNCFSLKFQRLKFNQLFKLRHKGKMNNVETREKQLVKQQREHVHRLAMNVQKELKTMVFSFPIDAQS